MQRIIRNTLLNYLPKDLIVEQNVNPLRIYELNNADIISGKIIYLMQREIRPFDNFALQFCQEMSFKLGMPYKIICSKFSCNYMPKENFINNQIEHVKGEFLKKNIDFSLFIGNSSELFKYLQKEQIAMLIVDFNPILNRDELKKFPFKVYEVDSHNVVPARFLSDKQEYGASTIRRKIYRNIYPFFTEYKEKSPISSYLQDFIENKLPYYAKYRNDPTKNVQSGLSKYLNLGFISSQRVALEVFNADVSDENKEAFFEELIVQMSLADNFCLYCSDFKSLKCIQNWAKNTILEHKNDIREYIYSTNALEEAKTHDKLWNATQKQLVRDGVIHGYLRMYWAKQIARWTKTAQDALDVAIYLNDKYAYDSPSPNGYAGILWSIGALHDRAFVNRYITGKIRTMTYKSISKKFDINKYIEKYQ